MNLKGKRIKSRSYDHPLASQLPLRLSDLEKRELVPAMLNGDVSAKERVICGHIGLAMSIVGRYVAVLKSKRWADELVSSALLALTRKVNRIVDSKINIPPEAITPMLTVAIHNGIANGLERLKIVRVPQITNRVRIKEGKEPITEPKVLSYDSDEGKARLHGEDTIVRASDDAVMRQGWWKTGVRKTKSPSCDDPSTILYTVIRSPFVLAVCERRLNGQSDRDIAAELGVNHMKVHTTRRNARNRLEKEIDL
jgi:hypothetical protein